MSQKMFVDLAMRNYNEIRSGYDVMKKDRPYPCFYKIDVETNTAKMCYLENYRDGFKRDHYGETDEVPE